MPPLVPSVEAAPSEVVSRLRLVVMTLVLSACGGNPQTDLGVNPKDDAGHPVEGGEDTDTTDTPSDSDSEVDTSDTSDTTTDTTPEVEEPPEEVADNMAPWPTSDDLGANIAAPLMSAHSGFEPSGVVWDEDSETYFVVGDDGDLAQLGEYGSLENYWTLSGNLEGIARDPSAGVFYVADESSPSTIRGVDADASAFTEQSCVLTDLPVEDPLGFEAIAFVPAEYAPAVWGSNAQGFLVAGSQLVSDLYVYEATGCADGIEASPVATFSTTATDVSAIHFSTITRRFYVLHDGDDSFDVLKVDGTWVQTYDLPVGSGESAWAEQEGITLGTVECGDDYAKAEAELVIATDSGGLYVFPGFPVACQWSLVVE